MHARLRGVTSIVFVLATVIASLMLYGCVKDAALKIYEGGPHGVADTHKDRLNDDLLAFIGEGARR